MGAAAPECLLALLLGLLLQVRPRLLVLLRCARAMQQAWVLLWAWCAASWLVEGLGPAAVCLLQVQPLLLLLAWRAVLAGCGS